MKNKDGRLLIVDDNEELLVALSLYLSPHFGDIKTLNSPGRIPEMLDRDDFDLVLLDMNFKAGVTSGNEGIYWMNRILEIDPTVSVVFITAFGDVELAVKAIREGATDFIEKSWDENKILSTVLSAYRIRQSKKEIQKLRQKHLHQNEQQFDGHEFCRPSSPASLRVEETIRKIAGTEVNVLILGENGTGKDVAAREIHRMSARSSEIFVPVDLGSLHENLFESELFGYVKGAFTDAKESRPGRFEVASGGTLYLNEIGNLPLSLQSKLLSAIEDRKITRLGSTREIPVDIRLVCATNRPLYELAERGEFREDLLYRINTIQIDIPPLRERSEDIPELAGFFLRDFSSKYGKRVSGISRNGMEKLLKYSWPGNIRELQHCMEKAVILSERPILDASDFQFYSRPANAPAFQSFNLEENEKKLIAQALRKFAGNISQTSRELGINRSTLYEKIRKYGL